MCSHIDILHTGIGKELAETPADTVHIVLHGDFRLQTGITELFQGIQGSGQCLLVRQFDGISGIR